MGIPVTAYFISPAGRDRLPVHINCHRFSITSPRRSLISSGCAPIRSLSKLISSPPLQPFEADQFLVSSGDHFAVSHYRRRLTGRLHRIVTVWDDG